MDISSLLMALSRGPKLDEKCCIDDFDTYKKFLKLVIRTLEIAPVLASQIVSQGGDNKEFLQAALRPLIPASD